MSKRILTTLLSAGAIAVCLGGSALPAGAQARTVTIVVTLQDDQVVTVAGLVLPDGRRLAELSPQELLVLLTQQDKATGITGPIRTAVEVGAPEPGPTTTTAPSTTTTTTTTTTTVPAPTQTAPTPTQTQPTPTTTIPEPREPPQDDAKPTEPAKPQQQRQRTTGRRRHPASEDRKTERRTQKRRRAAADRGSTTPSSSGSDALLGPTPIGVPNFFIEKFQIPPFLLPIYQAAGIEYGVPWQVLAAINEIETDYGRNLSVSSAGAVGWMQFLTSSWKTYGVDANNDGRKDPYNPVDAVFAAGRYLKAAGAEKSLRRAIFAYNHADWYVQSVLLRARLIGGLPADLVGSLTGMTQGYFPVHARARYAGDVTAADARRREKLGDNAAVTVDSRGSRRSIDIFTRAGAPVIAVNDGKVVGIGRSPRLGRFLILRDVYGNRYTYGHLGEIARSYPVPKPRTVTKDEVNAELALPGRDPKPKDAASAGRQRRAKDRASTSARGSRGRPAAKTTTAARETSAPAADKERLFANPARPRAFHSGGEQQLLERGRPVAGYTTFKAYFSRVFGLDRRDVRLERLREGSNVIGGTILARVAERTKDASSHVTFEIRPAGKGSPRVDPKPILDGWKLLESTAIYRAAGRNPFFGPDAQQPSIGQILLMSKEELERRVLADPRIDVYECGRRDIRAGQIDRRVLGTLAFLANSGLKPTVTSLKCGHGFYTASGNVSEHSSGNAVDIAAVNGIPIYGHQGPGTVTELAVRRLLTLQGAMRPHQIISLMTFDGADNTLALADHADHIHVGFKPMAGASRRTGQAFNAILEPGQWLRLVDRLGQIDNPVVPIQPSRYAIKVTKREQRGGD